MRLSLDTDRSFAHDIWPRKAGKEILDLAGLLRACEYRGPTRDAPVVPEVGSVGGSSVNELEDFWE